MADALSPKRVGMISLNLEIDSLPFLPTTQYMDHFNSNLGNLAFSYAVDSHIVSPKRRTGDLRVPPSRYKEFFDVLVFPAANNLNEKQDLRWLGDVIEASGLPIVIVGMGAQAAAANDVLTVPEGTERFIDILRERRLPIGVRGEFTRSFLEKRGYGDSVVMGCPSNFLNPNMRLGREIAASFERLPPHPSIALNLEYFRLEREMTTHLTGWLTGNGGFLVFQSDTNLIALHRRDVDFDVSDVKYQNLLKYYSKYFLGVVDEERFRLFASQYGRTFINLPSWIDALRSVDLSVGTRFHGNMLAIQAGRPAIVFVHDTRTHELCVSTGVPFVPWNEIGTTDDLESIIKRVTFDGDVFDRERVKKARLYCWLLESAGIVVSAQLKKLTEQEI